MPPAPHRGIGSDGGDNGVHIYWHRDLPPLEAEAIGEHVLEAASDHVQGCLLPHDEQWHAGYENLMAHARDRLVQEVVRLGGHHAHVLKEAIEVRRSDDVDEAWLHGRFEYMLFRRGNTSRAG